MTALPIHTGNCNAHPSAGLTKPSIDLRAVLAKAGASALLPSIFGPAQCGAKQKFGALWSLQDTAVRHAIKGVLLRAAAARASRAKRPAQSLASANDQRWQDASEVLQKGCMSRQGLHTARSI